MDITRHIRYSVQHQHVESVAFTESQNLPNLAINVVFLRHLLRLHHPSYH